eukprot:gene18360-biopygen23411
MAKDVVHKKLRRENIIIHAFGAYPSFTGAPECNENGVEHQGSIEYHPWVASHGAHKQWYSWFANNGISGSVGSVHSVARLCETRIVRAKATFIDSVDIPWTPLETPWTRPAGAQFFLYFEHSRTLQVRQNAARMRAGYLDCQL